MPDEGFLGPAHQAVVSLQPLIVVALPLATSRTSESPIEPLGIRVGKSIALAENVGQVDPNRDFDAFQGIENE